MPRLPQDHFKPEVILLAWSLYRSVSSGTVLLVRLDGMQEDPLDGAACGIWLLYYQYHHTVYGGAELSRLGLSPVCGVGPCREHLFKASYGMLFPLFLSRTSSFFEDVDVD
jgi:hypothetical protein